MIRPCACEESEVYKIALLRVISEDPGAPTADIARVALEGVDSGGEEPTAHVAHVDHVPSREPLPGPSAAGLMIHEALRDFLTGEGHTCGPRCGHGAGIPKEGA